MKSLKVIFIISILLLSSGCGSLTESTRNNENTPKIEWEKFLGGSNDDVAYSIEQTRDGGFIVSTEE